MARARRLQTWRAVGSRTLTRLRVWWLFVEQELVGQAEQCQEPVDRASVNDHGETPSLLAQAAVAVTQEMRAGAVHEVHFAQGEDDRPAVGIGLAQGTLKLWERGEVELARECHLRDRSGVASPIGHAQHAASVGAGGDGLGHGSS